MVRAEPRAKKVLGLSAAVFRMRHTAWGDMFCWYRRYGNTPIMRALWDNGMHEPTSCYVSSLSSRGANGIRNNAETCHVDKLGLAVLVGNIICFLRGTRFVTGWLQWIKLSSSADGGETLCPYLHVLKENFTGFQICLNTVLTCLVYQHLTHPAQTGN